MLYPLNNPFRKNIENITFMVEGGYMAKQKGDYETLFGLTSQNFNAKAVNAYLAKIPAQEFAKFPKVVHDELLEISQGGSPSELMQYIGAMLQPQTKATVTGTHTPTRTNERPRNGATAEELTSINVVKDLVTFHYEREYSAKFGFDKLPDSIAFKSMDIAINSGGGRATWALVKAARESGLLSDEEFNSAKYPYLTGDEASNKKNFGKHGKGHAYAAQATRISKEIAEKLDDASPTQLQMMNSKMDTWRNVFYQERAKDSPYIARVLTGLMNRIEQVDDVLHPNEAVAKATPSAPAAKPIVQAANAQPKQQAKEQPHPQPQAKSPQVRTQGIPDIPPVYSPPHPAQEMQQVSFQKGGGVLPPPLSAASCDTSPRPIEGSMAVAAQMVAMDKGITKWANAEVALQVPGYAGLVRYKVDQKTLKIVELEELPQGMRWTNGKGQPAYTNQPIEESAGDYSLSWQDGSGRNVNLYITPTLHEQLRKVSEHTMPVTGKPLLPASLELDAAGLDKRASVAIDILRHKKGVDTVIVRDDSTDEKLLVSPQLPVCNVPVMAKNDRGR